MGFSFGGGSAVRVLAAASDSYKGDNMLKVVDVVNDTPLPDAYSPALESALLPTPGRARILFQSKDGIGDAAEVRIGDVIHIPLGLTVEDLNPVLCHGRIHAGGGNPGRIVVSFGPAGQSPDPGACSVRRLGRLPRHPIDRGSVRIPPASEEQPPADLRSQPHTARHARVLCGQDHLTSCHSRSVSLLSAMASQAA